MKTIEFFCFRYFIIESYKYDPKGQMNILNFIHTKKKLFIDFVELLENNHYLRAGKKHLYFNHRFDESIISLKFAREKLLTQHNRTETDITESKTVDYPFLNVIINTESQLLLLQKTSSVFKDTLAAKKSLEKFILSFLKDKEFIFKLDEISYQRDFWSIVESSDKIFSLKLNLKSPNLFWGIHKANDAMKELKKTYNITESNFELKNDAGLLEIPKERIDDKIDYISDGGGNYKIVFSNKDNKKITKTSIDNIKRVHLDENISKVTDLKLKLEEIDEISKIIK